MDSTRAGRSWWTGGRLALVAIAVIVVVALLVVLAVVDRGSEPEAVAYQESTEQVTRMDLVDRETVEGTLTFGDARDLVTRVGGTVTAIKPEGAVVTRGEVLWRVDQRPTVLMIGSIPAYRTLTIGATGSDVRQLERNLRRLGYDGFAVDNEFTSGTADAVSAWQDDVGLAETGSLAIGQVVFSPNSVRVAARLTQRGTLVRPGLHMLTVTSNERQVDIDLDTADQSLATRGDTVKVTLPDGRVIGGRITSIGTVATSDATSGQQNALGEGGAASVPVTVKLDRPGKARKWDSAPVDVALEADRADGVLTVPVTALLALAEGGYALEVVDGPERRLIGVSTGLFAGGRVEVSGDGIAEGTEVVVPTR